MKWITTLLTLALLTALTVPHASALEYSFDGAEDYDFARPTSDGTIYVGEPANIDRSKDAALVPPTFTETVSPTLGVGFTDAVNDLHYEDGSIGTLSIPTLGVSARVYDGTDSATLAKGIGHFFETSIWDGNCAFAAHNRGVNALFGQIHTLKVGDSITLTTKLGTRTYTVTSIEKVLETDTSKLAATVENCVTLYTCVRNEPQYRWCVRATA